MTTNRADNVHNDPNGKLRSVMADLRRVHQEKQRLTEWLTGKIALRSFPDHYREVMVALHEAGLLATAVIDYVDEEKRCINFAWPRKRIGLRLIPLPLFPGDRRIPDFAYNDAALREREWLILFVDPRSHSSKRQLDRVVSVVKSMGEYRPVSR